MSTKKNPKNPPRSKDAPPKNETILEPDQAGPVPEGRCSRCGNRAGKKIGAPSVQKHEGYHEGKPYSLIERQRICCGRCGQHFMLRKFR